MIDVRECDVLRGDRFEREGGIEAHEGVVGPAAVVAVYEPFDARLVLRDEDVLAGRFDLLVAIELDRTVVMLGRGG
jgi:hypothetical protein